MKRSGHQNSTLYEVQGFDHSTIWEPTFSLLPIHIESILNKLGTNDLSLSVNKVLHTKHNTMKTGCLVIIIMLCIISVPVSADVKLPSIIGNNMVLQQDMEVPVWGKASPNEVITVIFNGQKVTTKSGKEGNWIIYLAPMSAGGPFSMNIAGYNKIELTNILIGEVWIGSGQSNMQLPVKNSAKADEEISNAKLPDIRLFTVKHRMSDELLEDCQGEWVECSPLTVGNFSAVTYFFGKNLYKAKNTPFGLIHSSWGGTTIEAWISREFLMSSSDFKPILERYAEALENVPNSTKEYEIMIHDWEIKVKQKKAEDKEIPPKPIPPLGLGHPHTPTVLFNGMIAPIIPYTIRGVIWYQGESNATRAFQYRSLFPTLINNWRYLWNQGPFPFLFVQLANYSVPVANSGESIKEPCVSPWAGLREAQLMTLSQKNTRMVVSIDIGDANDIHPKNKQDVGYRLSLAARGIVYGENIVYSGPVYSSIRIVGDKARINFDHTGSGLMAKGGDLKGFTIAGQDRTFVWAEAIIERNAVIVHSQKVSDPVAVRYAWADNPKCNLYNEEGLPASPFRTDNWPGITHDVTSGREFIENNFPNLLLGGVIFHE